ncbi:TM2 domain-containing protein [Leifsonia sp. NPDC058248]|uniref:TM2 domain-containing protein n=1 Tax=Leifsonia sp. NPDC058248 TaxID=3346402 RepID=UPI0036DB08F1
MSDEDGAAASQPAASVVPAAPVQTAPVVPAAAAAPAAPAVPAASSSVTNVYVQLPPPPAAALMPKSPALAYLAMGFSLIGLCGMQHFYLGKLGQGVLWLITFGLFGFGTVADLFTLRSQTKTINARRALGIA